MIDLRISRGAAPSPHLARRRGRPPAAQTAQRDAHILDVAEQLFLERGFCNVSMAMISRETGIAPKTICTRFSDKKGLLERLIERQSEDDGLAVSLARAGSDVKVLLHRLAFHASEYLLVAKANSTDRNFYLHQGLWYERLAETFREGRWWLGAKSMRDTDILADLFIGCLMREHVLLTAGAVKGECTANAIYQIAANTVLRFFAVATRGIG